MDRLDWNISIKITNEKNPGMLSIKVDAENTFCPEIVRNVIDMCIILLEISGAEEDALGIYSKYLALNAAQPVGITDEIRQQVEGIYTQLNTW